MSFLDRASSFRRSGFEHAPFVFSYDISSPKLARAVRRCLQRWRMDGQLSVHEVVLTPLAAEILSVELIELVDPATDSLIVFRLSRRGDGPIYHLSTQATTPPFAHRMATLPQHLHDGWYIVAYDITDKDRLRQIHRIAKHHGVFLQRSVYLFHGKGTELAATLRTAKQLLLGEDDLRLYALSGADDLWFLCGTVPPLTGLFTRASISTARTIQPIHRGAHG